MWVRGLKLCNRHIYLYRIRSHPMWVRGLKLQRGVRWRFYLCRTLCGCVD